MAGDEHIAAKLARTVVALYFLFAFVAGTVLPFQAGINAQLSHWLHSPVRASFVSFDLQELSHQLARVDDTQLLMHLARLRYMEDQLRSAALDSEHRLALLDSLGHELDSARRVVRPYFSR